MATRQSDVTMVRPPLPRATPALAGLTGCEAPSHAPPERCARASPPSACQADDEEAAALELKKKRTFRKFTYRGIDLDNLLDLTPEQLVSDPRGGRAESPTTPARAPRPHTRPPLAPTD